MTANHDAGASGPAQALPGRDAAVSLPEVHAVSGHRMAAPFPAGFEKSCFALGCFWGAERRYWQQPGVYLTIVGYTGGLTPNPNYREVCSGLTGHTEAVLVVFDPAITSFAALLRVFWESHDPTQGMRQGNDIGTQYRSGVYAYSDAQLEAALESRATYQRALSAAGYGSVTSEIRRAGPFYAAEEYHQQYLAKNPGGYCGLGGTGVPCGEGLQVPA